MSDKLPQWKDGDLISASKMNAMVNAINNMEGGDGEVDLSGYVTETELNTKQDKLVSGTNIKTINGTSILGSGNIVIEGGSNAGSTASPLPDYWKTYLNTKATGINAINESLGSKGDAFIFITDTHIPNNYGNSIHAINELCRLTSINKIFFGGDMIASAGSASAMTQKARELVKDFDAHLEVHPMRGNHDTDHNASANQYWDAFFRNIGRYCEVDGNMYYCRDDKAVKVRYIIMDSIYTEGRLGVNLPDEEQLNWVKEKILELQPGWSALIVTHSIWIGTGEIGEAGRLILDTIDEVYDTARCTIIGVMCGHCHADKNETFDKGYIAFSSLYDFKGGTAGTTSEQVFDVVNIDLENGKVYTTRIGRGNDRVFSYKTNLYIPVTGVSLDSEKTSYVNKTFTLKALVLPEGANSEVTWSIVSGIEYISITPNNNFCKVKCNAVGNAVIKATTTEGFEATCVITVLRTLSEVDITDRFVFETGSVNYQTGEDNDDQNYIRSDYTDISGCESLTIAMPQTINPTTTHGLAFYDDEKSYISGVQLLTGGGWGCGTKEVEVPSIAKYIRVVFYGDNHAYLPTGITSESFTCIAKMYV